MADKKPHVVLASGGTGGHLFPAESLARKLLDKDCEVTMITDSRGKVFENLSGQVHVQSIRAATMKPGLPAKIKAMMNIGIGILQASFFLIKKRPDVVIGFGGYPSFPTVFAAQKLGIKTILHEQNAVLGKANAWLAPGAKVIATSLPDVGGLSDKDKSKAVLTGNPVRAEICEYRDAPYTAPKEDGVLNIFVLGGSQGAQIFSEIIPTAMEKLPDSLKPRINLVQQCRADDIEAVRSRYKRIGIEAELESFFSDVPGRLNKCHLYIGRSGASSVAELAVIGRPAIFIPLMINPDQKANADAIADAGGGWVMLQEGFTPEALVTRIETFISLPQSLEQVAKASHACGRPEAAEELAKLVLSEIRAKIKSKQDRNLEGEAA